MKCRWPHFYSIYTHTHTNRIQFYNETNSAKSIVLIIMKSSSIAHHCFAVGFKNHCFPSQAKQILAIGNWSIGMEPCKFFATRNKTWFFEFFAIYFHSFHFLTNIFLVCLWMFACVLVWVVADWLVWLGINIFKI